MVEPAGYDYTFTFDHDHDPVYGAPRMLLLHIHISSRSYELYRNYVDVNGAEKWLPQYSHLTMIM